MAEVSLLRSSLRLARPLVLPFALTAAGCTVLSGAADLKTEAASGPAARGSSGGDGTGVVGRDDGGGSTGSDAATDAGGGTTATRLREITFEDGSLTGAHGADKVTGAPVAITTGALRGKHAMAVTGGSSFVEASIAEASDVYVSFVFAVSSMPPSGTYVTIARFTFAGVATTLDISVASDGGLRIAASTGSTLTLNSIAIGVTYRVGLHVHPGNGGGGSTTIEPKVVEGATSPFGGGSASIGIGSLGAMNGIALGALGTESIVALFDHVLFDSDAMPDP